MDYPRLVGLMYLKRWQIEASGFLEPPYVFDFEISCPRPSVGTARRELVVTEEAGEVVDWTERCFRDRLVFKEILEGPTSLGASVYPVELETSETATDLLGRLSAEFASEYLNLRFWTLNKLVELLQESGVGDLGAGLDRTLATGSTRLDVDSPRESFTLKLPLRTPEEIRDPAPTPRGVGKEEAEEADVLKNAGDSNGFLEFEIELLER